MAMEDRYYPITVSKGDSHKTEAILQKHVARCNISDWRGDCMSGGVKDATIVYWICPYISEDLETIKQDLVNNGITLF